MSCDLSDDPFSFGRTSGGGEAAASAAPAAQTFSDILCVPFSGLLKKYRFDTTVKPHGSGTFGKVYLGVVQETGRPVAVKKIFSRSTPRNPKSSPEAVIREATTAMLFDSPNLCKVYGFSVDDAGFVYIVMEQINGIEAFDFFNDNIRLGKTNPCLVKRIFLDIARGLATLHKAGFAHRDIKLDNVMLEFSKTGEFERAVIIDFGFTMLVSEIPHGSQQGSICYSAPEMIKGVDQLTVKIDIWALGVMLFVSLHGYYPIWSKNPNPSAEAREVYQKLQKLTESPVLPIYTEGNKDVNILRMICARCLDFDQSTRISADELLALLS
jgi:serine/threonine protein kinase